MSKVVSATRRSALPFIGENTPSGVQDDDDHESKVDEEEEEEVMEEVNVRHFQSFCVTF